MLRELVNSLSGKSITIDAKDQEVRGKANATYNTICTRSDRKFDPRTDNQILLDCYRGTIREVGIARLTGGVINDQIPVWEDRSTYAWDVQAKKILLEIKPQDLASQYFCVKTITADRMKRNTSYYDYVISTAARKLNESEWLIIPCLMIKSTDFNSFCKKSIYKNWQSIYNPHMNPVIKLNDWSKDNA